MSSLMFLGVDELGVFRLLDDDRALRIERRMFNSLLTISQSQASPGWLEGW